MEPSDLMESAILLRWILLAPLAAALVNILWGSRMNRQAAGWLASIAVAVSFVLSLWIWPAVSNGSVLNDALFTWIESPPFKVAVSLIVDPLTLIMLLVVTGVGLLIHIYSLGYMAGDEGEVRYFAYLNLFIFFMLLLVLADNLLLLFVGWEGVGLCSFLLIGFWYQDHTNTIAANKAFVVNRIGDVCFLLGVLLLFWELGLKGVWTLDFTELESHAPLLSTGRVTLITLLLFAGATGKSAQIPLYVWLPDAMQGPTPVSALIHAATMVTAGVYMTARMHFLFTLAPATLTVIALIGVLTALLAATIAMTQNDIKRVLAYSTVSQLGYMFLAVGVGAYSAAVFHLFTHAFFKACLFLSAGSVIHGMDGEQDMRKMGGLRPYFPVTYWSYLIAGLAISGAPLTAGFFSKDQILWQTFTHGSALLWLVAWLVAGLTAFYMFRQFFMVFHGKSNVSDHQRAHLHESPGVMTVPLMLLALGSIVSGWLSTPDYLLGSAWDSWLQPVFGSGEHAHGHILLEIALTVLTVGLAAGAIYFAYHRATLPSLSGLPYRLASNKYYVDELYDFIFVRPVTRLASCFAATFDPRIVDRFVNGLGARVQASSFFWRQLQSGNVQHYLLYFLAGTLLVFGYYLF